MAALQKFTNAADHAGHAQSVEGRVDVPYAFPRAGAYRLWAQFRLGDGKVVTAPFVVHAR